MKSQQPGDCYLMSHTVYALFWPNSICFVCMLCHLSQPHGLWFYPDIACLIDCIKIWLCTQDLAIYLSCQFACSFLSWMLSEFLVYSNCLFSALSILSSLASFKDFLT